MDEWFPTYHSPRLPSWTPGDIAACINSHCTRIFMTLEYARIKLKERILSHLLENGSDTYQVTWGVLVAPRLNCTQSSYDMCWKSVEVLGEGGSQTDLKKKGTVENSIF